MMSASAFPLKGWLNRIRLVVVIRSGSARRAELVHDQRALVHQHHGLRPSGAQLVLGDRERPGSRVNLKSSSAWIVQTLDWRLAVDADDLVVAVRAGRLHAAVVHRRSRRRCTPATFSGPGTWWPGRTRGGPSRTPSSASRPGRAAGRVDLDEPAGARARTEAARVGGSARRGGPAEQLLPPPSSAVGLPVVVDGREQTVVAEKVEQALAAVVVVGSEPVEARAPRAPGRSARCPSSQQLGEGLRRQRDDPQAPRPHAALGLDVGEVPQRLLE